MKVGDRLRLTQDIYEDGEDVPPGYIGLKGDTVIVRRISHGGKGGERIYVSHEHITDNAFLVYRNEFEIPEGA